MTGKWKSRLLKYGISTAICVAATALYLWGRDYEAATAQDIVRYISDGFCIPGIMTMLAGLLVVVSNEGAFTGVGYALSVAAKTFLPGGRLKTETYADYVERKQGRQVKGFGFLFIVGAIYTAIGCVFWILYYFQ